MKMVMMVMVMRRRFDVDAGDDDLSFGLSTLLNGFQACVEKAQAFDLGDLGSSLCSAS